MPSGAEPPEDCVIDFFNDSDVHNPFSSRNLVRSAEMSCDIVASAVYEFVFKWHVLHCGEPVPEMRLPSNEQLPEAREKFFRLWKDIEVELERAVEEDESLGFSDFAESSRENAKFVKIKWTDGAFEFEDGFQVIHAPATRIIWSIFRFGQPRAV